MLADRVDVYHNARFDFGTRVLLLKARHKDGTVGRERAIQRVTHSTEEFTSKLGELRDMLRPGERIYSTANPRCLKKSARLFSERMMNALHDPEPVKTDFYKNLPHRWYSCLMKPESVDSSLPKWWMWDCDTPEQYDRAVEFVVMNDLEHYWYQTKGGHHVLVKPFDRSKFPKDLSLTIGYPEMNPLILWSWR